MRILLLLLLFLLPSCTLYDNLNKLAQDAGDGATKAKEFYDKGAAKYAEAKAEADTNKDGETTTEEWWAWLLGGGGAVGAGIWQMLRRNKNSDERKTTMEQEIAVIKAKLPG